MFWTDPNTSNNSTRNGLVSSTGVSVRNHRHTHQRAKHHSGYSKGTISKTFNVKNSESWHVEYPGYSANNMTITLSEGTWPGHKLENDIGGVKNIYFTWSDVTQTIKEINDLNNTITWTTHDSTTGNPYIHPNRYEYSTIIWTRQ
jgi:hypothetical protein